MVLLRRWEITRQGSCEAACPRRWLAAGVSSRCRWAHTLLANLGANPRSGPCRKVVPFPALLSRDGMPSNGAGSAEKLQGGRGRGWDEACGSTATAGCSPLALRMLSEQKQLPQIGGRSVRFGNLSRWPVFCLFSAPCS